MNNSHPLSLRTKLGFGVCDVGGNLFFTAMSFQFAAFATDTLGLGAVLMGVAVMVGRISDAITDPIMGYISDRTRSRWGRRRPYIFLGAVPLAFLFYLIFAKPAFISTQTGLFVWVAVLYILLTTANTMVNIPYGALTPDLSRDYNEQTSLNAFRMSFAVVGTLIGAGAALPIIGSAADKVSGYARLGMVFGAVALISAWITVFSVREPVLTEQNHRPGLFREYLNVITDRTFLKILIPWAAFITGVTVASGILIYFVRYVLNDEKFTTLVMVVLLITALVFIPVWVRISRKIGKKNSYITGMLIFAVAVLVIAYIGERLPSQVLLLIVGLAGVGLSTHYIMPYSLIPDAVENNYADTGKRRAGVYYGLWTFCSKLGQALAILLTGIILDATKYVPNAVQQVGALQGIRFILGVLPMVFILIGVFVLRLYPIDRAFYQGILDKISQIEPSGERVYE